MGGFMGPSVPLPSSPPRPAALLSIVNIVTGVFVDSAMRSNNKDKDIIVHEELEVKKEYLKQMEEIFIEMDEDGKGTITLQEFENKLSDERVIAFFNFLKLDVNDASALFQLLDYDNSSKIDIDEFLDGCYRLQGDSRALDMKIMQFEIKFLKERFDAFGEVLERIANNATSAPHQIKSKPEDQWAYPGCMKQCAENKHTNGGITADA